MANIKVPHVKVYQDRHGKRRFYYRRAGYDSVSLPDPSSAEFLAAYAQAASSKPAIGKTRTREKTLNAAVLLYYASPKFTKLQPQTQANYRNMLDRFRDKYGDIKITAFTTHRLDKIFAKMSDTPGAARNLRKRLNPVFRVVIKAGWRADNPITESETPDAKSDGFTPWTEAHIAKFRKRWLSGSRERLALELLLNTGARRSDAVVMGPKHRANGRLTWQQKKTGAWVTVPINDELDAELAIAPEGETYLQIHTGAQFSEAGFTQWFGEAADAADCEGMTPHGLRKAAGRRLAEAGCSAKQIAAVLGHTSTREAETYTKDADKIRLTADAFERLDQSNRLSNSGNSPTITNTSSGVGRPGGTVTSQVFQPRRRSNRPLRRP